MNVIGAGWGRTGAPPAAAAIDLLGFGPWSSRQVGGWQEFVGPEATAVENYGTQSDADHYRFAALHLHPVGFALTIWGILLNQAICPPPAAAWFGWAFYPKLLLGHASAARRSDRRLGRSAAHRTVSGR